MIVRPDGDAFLGKSEPTPDFLDCFRALQSPIGIDHEARRRPLEHDPPARVLVVFAAQNRQRQAVIDEPGRARLAPKLPMLGMAAVIGQAIAVFARIGERSAGGDERAFDAPEYPDRRVLQEIVQRSPSPRRLTGGRSSPGSSHLTP